MEARRTIKHNNKDIDVYDEMPTGWSYIKGALTAPLGYAWISNNKSILSREKRLAFIKLDW